MQRKEARDYIKLLPISLILLIVPLIVYLKAVNLDDVVVNYWTGTKQVIDFFSYYKMVWFIALTGIAALLFIGYIITNKIKITFQRLFIPLSIYFIFVFLSSTFSKFHQQAFFGFPDRFEGFLTILCYILVCFFCSILITSKFDIKYLFAFLAVSVFIISIIGITQFFGFDFLQSNVGKHLILPKANYNLADSLKFNFPEKHIYATLYNPNYVGGFFGMILPIILVIFIQTKSIYGKILSGLLCILSFINLIGSLSTTGYIGMVAAGIAIIIFLRKDLWKNLIPLASIIISFCIIIVFMNNSSDGAIFKELKISNFLTQNDTKLEVSELQNISNATTQKTNLADIKIETNDLYLYVTADDALVIKYDKPTTQLLFYDIANNYIDVIANTENEKVILNFNDNRFKDFRIIVENTLVKVEAPNTIFNIAVTENGFKFVSPSGQMTDIIKAKSIGFEGNERWGSSRGYIWSRSIPMIKDTILIGHGPDTYTMYFPQNDYIAKLNYLDNLSTIVDKPHNWYLQIAINTGLLSLIAFLVFVGWYCITSLRLYFQGRKNEYYAPGLACFIAVISFLVSSLGNDSTISVSPVFWILLGTGIACNRLYSKVLLSSNKTTT